VELFKVSIAHQEILSRKIQKHGHKTLLLVVLHLTPSAMQLC